jgi:hypothetical protein
MHALIWSSDARRVHFRCIFLARASRHDQERGAVLRADITARAICGCVSWEMARFPVKPFAKLRISREGLRRD